MLDVLATVCAVKGTRRAPFTVVGCSETMQSNCVQNFHTSASIIIDNLVNMHGATGLRTAQAASRTALYLDVQSMHNRLGGRAVRQLTSLQSCVISMFDHVCTVS